MHQSLIKKSLTYSGTRIYIYKYNVHALCSLPKQHIIRHNLQQKMKGTISFFLID